MVLSVLGGPPPAVFSLRVPPDTQPRLARLPSSHQAAPSHPHPRQPSSPPGSAPRSGARRRRTWGPARARADSGATLSLWQVPRLRQSKSPPGPQARSQPGLCNMYQVRRLLPARGRTAGWLPPGASERHAGLTAGRLLGTRQRNTWRPRGGASRGRRGLDSGWAPCRAGAREGRETPAAGLAQPGAAGDCGPSAVRISA